MSDDERPLNEDPAIQEHFEVPLTIWINGEKKVIGTATIEGSKIRTIIDQPLAEDVLDYLAMYDGAVFSLESDLPGFGHRQFVRKYFNQPWWEGKEPPRDDAGRNQRG
jgi:hypothetical protein